MTKVFLSIINMSISASWVLLAVLVLRLLLKKAPKWIAVVLWGVVAIRLICPISLESIFSLIPSAETVSPDIMTEQIPTINTGIPIINSTLNPVIGEPFTPIPGASANPLQIWIPILTSVWITGVAMLFAYMLISYIRVKRRIGTAILYRDNIWQSENVVSPFVLGLIKPKIFLPFSMRQQDMDYVLAHEQAHIRRKDHLWKPVGFLLLALHWFNPLMWLGYILLCRDIELACDEKVIKELDYDARADYSQALLTCSVNRRVIAACPLAFGEVGVKERVKSVLNYKKPAFWIIIGAIVICIVVAVCFLTNPPQKDDNPEPGNAIFTEYEGVYLVVESVVDDTDGNKRFHVTMHNDTDERVFYGTSYLVERKVGDDWVSVAIEDLYFTMVAFLLNPGKTEQLSYTTEKFDISQFGTYRLVVPFSIDEGNGYKDYKTWIEYKVDDPVIGSSELYTECEGVYLSIDWIDLDAKGNYGFNLILHNNSDNQVKCIEDAYYIERKDGNEWVSVELAELSISEYAYTVNPERVMVLYCVTENYDVSKEGLYRLIVPFCLDEMNESREYNAWVLFKVEDLPTVSQLQQKLPQFFNLNANDGLVVYQWQRGEGTDMHCYYLVTEEMDRLSDQSFAFKEYATRREMKDILATYDIDKEKIRIVPVKNPLCSYDYEITDTYRAKVQSTLENDLLMYVAPHHYLENTNTRVYDRVIFDIDNDGIDEVCTLRDAMLSGPSAFVLSVSEIGSNKIPYSAWCYGYHKHSLSFHIGADGVLRVQVITPDENPETYYLDIAFEDGHLELLRDGMPISPW